MSTTKKSAKAATDKTMVSMRLSTEARVLLEGLAKHHGIDRTAVLEQLIRREGRKLLPKNS